MCRTMTLQTRAVRVSLTEDVAGPVQAAVDAGASLAHTDLFVVGGHRLGELFPLDFVFGEDSFQLLFES